MDHGRLFYPCLIFDDALRLVDTTPYQNIPIFALRKARLLLTRIAAPKPQPTLGDINLIDGGVLLNVLNQKGLSTTVNLGTGEVVATAWPTQMESNVSCLEWKIILPSALSPERCDPSPIFERSAVQGK